MMSTGTINQQTMQILSQRHALPVGVIETLIHQATVREQWVGQVTVDHALLTEIELAQILAEHQRLELIDLTRVTPDDAALACLTAETCRRFCVVPVQLQGTRLLLAAANPVDGALDELLGQLRAVYVVLYVAPLRSIDHAIDRWYTRTGATGAPVATPPIRPRYETRVTIHELLEALVRGGGSDLHLTVGMRPMMRVNGTLEPMAHAPLNGTDTEMLINTVLTEPQRAAFATTWELDTAYILPEVARFRVNVFRQSGHMGAIFRAIPVTVPTLEQLQMPTVIRELTTRAHGLVLVTGPTGMGKSTTLAAMVEEINRARRAHIMTVEDPIEFVHAPKNCEVNQRQIGTDTQSFSAALRHVLRQDPDIILIGEMRDQETIAAAITAAETGHLVFSTLHTISAVQTIDRIVDVFPPHQQNQIRTQLANVLEGIISQLLIPVADGKGRVCAQEILLATPAIRNLIREGKIHLIPSVIQANGKQGMQLMDQVLRELLLARRISQANAMALAEHPEDFVAGS